ncbi:MAG: ABC transporter ATP-binding protein, partial [Rhodothermales bacterium]
MASPSRHSEDKLHSQFDSRLLARIIHYLKPYKGWVLVAFALTFVASFLGPWRPKLVQEAIDNFIIPGDLDGLQWMIILLIGTLVAEGILSFARSYLTQWIGQQAIFDVRMKVYRHIQRQSLRFFDRTPVGRLITRTTSDVEALSDVLSAGLVVILGDLFRLGFILYFMLSLNWVLALVVLAVTPLMVYAVSVFRRKVRDQYRETRTQVARLNSFLQEHISGMSIIQAFNREREEMTRFSGINDDHRAAQIKTIFYFALFWPAVDIVASLALGLIIWFGGLRAMTGTLTLGVLIAFIQYTRQFFEPIRNLSDQYNTLQSAMAGAERIFGLLDEDFAIKELPVPTAVERFRGHIEFRNVWFTYQKELDQGQEPNWILQ